MLSTNKDSFWALGLMSGTSLDGIDAALIKTDGNAVLSFGPAATYPYSPAFRERLRGVLGKDPSLPAVRAIEEELTLLHAAAVTRLLAESAFLLEDVDVIGFHGHTLWHISPRLSGLQGRTCQIGDGALLARLCHLPVVNHFRDADVAAGGEGAPLVPIYHWALTREMAKPVMLINIGGIANVTWIDGGGPENLRAFDVGPGNCLLDEWMAISLGLSYDAHGEHAARGTVQPTLLKRLLPGLKSHLPPPKAFDRLDFSLDVLVGLPCDDGAATLVSLTAHGIVSAIRHVPQFPQQWILMGGGRKNRALFHAIEGLLQQEGHACKVTSAEAHGWDGDAIEAQAIAFLAVRSCKKLALSFPHTTGVTQPCFGGEWHLPS